MRRFLSLFLSVPLAVMTARAAPAASSGSMEAVIASKVKAPAQLSLKSSKSPHKIVKAKKPYQVGKASWYGRQFYGRPTASGEPFNMFNLTAAHRQLPLGSWVKVTNLRNGESVIVRINDRGPVPQSRIIDLSFEAATLLDLRARGVEKVRLDMVRPETVAMVLNTSVLQ